MAKLDRFIAGQLWIERHRRREGPPIVYTVMSGNASRAFTDKKEILRWVKWPKGTPTGEALRIWLDAEGGPDDTDPTADTKMIT